MPTLRPMYCRHCRQTLYSDDVVKCSACGQSGGMVDPDDPAALADLAAAKREEPDMMPTAGGVLAGYRVVKAGCVGVACLFLGMILLGSPMMWSDPRGPTLNDAAPAIILLLLGLGILVLMALPLFRGLRSSDRPGGPEEP